MHHFTYSACSLRLCPVIALIALFVLSAAPSVRAQPAARRADHIPMREISSSYEIHRIEFTGTNLVSPDILRGLIATRVSEKSPVRRFSEFYRREFERHPEIFATYIAQMRKLEHELGDVREYFNKEHIGLDTFRIKAYYNERGVHRTEVRVTFTHDAIQRENVLTFHIAEYPPAQLDTIVYLGLGGLPPDLTALIEEAATIRSGAIFSQAEIASQNNRLLAILQDNGYFHAAFKDPLVLYDADRNTDSVTVFCDPGRRLRIGDVFFIDSTHGQPPIAASFRRSLLEFQEGEWYSRLAIRRSEENLYRLGVYRAVSIDTSSERQPHTDSTLNFKVFTQMQNVRHVGASILTNKSLQDPFWNVGAEVFLEHRNTWHKAQTVQLYGRVLGHDINGWIERDFKNLTTEIEVGARVQQPYLFTTPFAQIGGGAQIFYSRRMIYKPLWLISYGLTGSLGWRFSDDLTGFTGFSAIYEQPIDFDIAYERALSQPGVNRSIVRRQMYQYAKLDTIARHYSFPSKAILEASAIYDTRSSPFTPDNGMYLSGSLEGALGGTEFIRTTLLWLGFTPLSSSEVLAFKVRAGHIFWFDRANTYIPLDRHFFAGGSNSVRAFGSRELRAEPVDTATSEEVRNLADFIGSGSLFEGSVEYRLKYISAPLSDGFWDQLFGRLGGAVFLDFGNAYNSFLESPNKYAAKTPAAFLKKISLGFGAGLRFATPVGPVRFDLAAPVYNPMTPSAPLAMKDLHWHIGIGHAF